MMTETAITQGVHHIGLTVPSLEQTRNFFTETLGFTVVGEKPDYPAAFVSDGSIMITLWQAQDPATAQAFDRKNIIGLHHFALKVPAQKLNDLHSTLLEHADVEVEFSPEDLGDGPARHMMCTIPGGIRVEFFALPD